MQPIKINCPECNHEMEYWTKGDTIYCMKCKEAINVEPCTEPLSHEMPDEPTEGEEDATNL